MNTLAINFNGPATNPGNGYIAMYRPKGSLIPFYSFTQTTGSPIRITSAILNNVDYEGTIQSTCGTSKSPKKAFSTFNYNNAVGNINVPVCSVLGAIGIVTNVTFNNVAILPLTQPFPVMQGQTAAFVSNIKGVYTLVVTHSFTAGTITLVDSLGTTYTQTILSGTNIFPLITINELLTFSLSVTC